MRIGQRLYKAIFSPTFELSAKDQQLLEQMYPKIDWAFVRFYNGLPWFMSSTTTIGTALPDSYNSRYINVYFKDYEQMSVYSKLLILVHEAFHIQQYQQLNSMGKYTSGWGLNRRFIRYYLGWYFQSFYEALFKCKHGFSKASRHAYRQHPMEVPAYDHEADFEKQVNLYRGHAVSIFFQQVPTLIIQDAMLPNKPSLIFYGMGAFLAMVISIIKPFLEVVFLLPIAYLLGGKPSTKTKGN